VMIFFWLYCLGVILIRVDMIFSYWVELLAVILCLKEGMRGKCNLLWGFWLLRNYFSKLLLSQHSGNHHDGRWWKMRRHDRSNYQEHDTWYVVSTSQTACTFPRLDGAVVYLLLSPFQNIRCFRFVKQMYLHTF
jgi:hypothetical protein